MYQSAPADLTVNIFEKTKVLIFIDYPLCAAFGPLLCLSGGQGRSKATPANIAGVVYKKVYDYIWMAAVRRNQRKCAEINSNYIEER